MPSARTRWIVIAGGAALAAIIVASLIPANMQIRTGLHWQTEHFLGYCVVAAIFSFAWPRPFIVGGALVAFAWLLEALQGLTPDRTPDLATAFAAAGGVLVGAVFSTALRRISSRSS